jgi:protocatechuate 3,4-dioxygenase beta subunit
MFIASSVLSMVLCSAAEGATPSPSRAAAIAGVVRDTTARPLRGALVVAHCTCLARPREVQTDDHGVYRLDGLPTGAYTVRVVFGPADVSRRVALEDGTRQAVHFHVDTRADARTGTSP